LANITFVENTETDNVDTLSIGKKSMIERNPKIIISKNKYNIESKMLFKMLHQPQPFSDDLDQDVESFFVNYKLVAIINE
jgi:hypothetical protein